MEDLSNTIKAGGARERRRWLLGNVLHATYHALAAPGEHPSKHQHGGVVDLVLNILIGQAGAVDSVEVPLHCGCQQDSLLREVNTAAPPKWGSCVDPAWGSPICWRSKRTELALRRWRRKGGGVGGFHFPEKVKVVLVLSLLLFLCNLCLYLKRAWGRKY